jgi:hypothetical protein
LLQLEEGDLDLVIGEVAEDTPWIARVSVIVPPLRGAPREGEPPVVAVARNGENDWISLLESEARNLAEAGR